jgi:hypothetical protein
MPRKVKHFPLRSKYAIASSPACLILNATTRRVAGSINPTGDPNMSKAKDTKRETKKAPLKTPAEKKQAKRDKKNKTT